MNPLVWFIAGAAYVLMAVSTYHATARNIPPECALDTGNRVLIAMFWPGSVGTIGIGSGLKMMLVSAFPFGGGIKANCVIEVRPPAAPGD